MIGCGTIARGACLERRAPTPEGISIMLRSTIVFAAHAASAPLAAEQAMPHSGMDYSKIAQVANPYMPADMAMHKR